MISYLKNKKERPLNCFFVYQAGRLQCLNGAYLSKIDSVLFSLIIESKIPPKDKEVSIENVLVNEKLRAGLLAYWRFNAVQEDGRVLDETGNGFDAIPRGSYTWIENVKCPY